MTPQVAEGGATPTENPRIAQLRAMFSRLAGSDGEIDSEELQDVLTASFSKGELNYDLTKRRLEPSMCLTAKMVVDLLMYTSVCINIYKYAYLVEQ